MSVFRCEIMREHDGRGFESIYERRPALIPSQGIRPLEYSQISNEIDKIAAKTHRIHFHAGHLGSAWLGWAARLSSFLSSLLR